jgi:hypothetical protein
LVESVDSLRTDVRTHVHFGADLARLGTDLG